MTTAPTRNTSYFCKLGGTISLAITNHDDSIWRRLGTPE